MSEIPKFNQDMFVDLGGGVCEQNYERNEMIFPSAFFHEKNTPFAGLVSRFSFVIFWGV